MALPTSGAITSIMILNELGYTTGSHTHRNVIQKVGNQLQTMVDGAWVNLNMCSPYLPSEVSPYIVASDWYGYNHSATNGVTSVTIQGPTSVNTGTAYDYTAQVNGTNQSGITYTWSITGGAATINSGQGTATANITWTNLTGAQLTLTIGNTCQGSNVATSVNITAACTAPSSVVISGNSNVYFAEVLQYTLNSFSGTSLGATYQWNVSNTFATVSSGQGSNVATISFSFTDPYASQSVNITCVVTNSCGNSTSNTITVTPYVFSNASETRDYQKNSCIDGGVGSVVSYTLSANTIKSYDSSTLTTLVNDHFNANGQNYANANGTCTWTGNDYATLFCKNDGCPAHYYPNCGNFFASWQAGGLSNYQSTVSKAAANQLAIDWVNANGQAWANANLGCYQYEFGNVAKSASAHKNDCSGDFCNTGTQRTYTIAANTIYRATQLEADTEAQNMANNGVQAWVNANFPGDCYQCKFYNDTAKTACTYRDNCGVGCNGSYVCLTRPVGAQMSTVSVAQANIDAQNYVDTNIQGHANTVGTCDCAVPAPSNLSVIGVDGTDQIRISYTDNCPDETGFELRYSTDNVSWSYIYPAANTTVNYIEGIPYNTLIYAEVRTVKGGNYSSWVASNGLSSPAPVGGLYSTTNGNIYQIALNWSNNNPNTGTYPIVHEIEGTKVSGPCFGNCYLSRSTNTSGFTFTDTYVYPINTPGNPGYGHYTYRVRSKNQNGVVSAWRYVYNCVPTTVAGFIVDESTDPTKCDYWNC